MNQPSETADHSHSLDLLEAQILTLVQEVQAKLEAAESSPNSSLKAIFDEIELSIKTQFFKLKTLLPAPQSESGFTYQSTIALPTIALSKGCCCHQGHRTNAGRAIPNPSDRRCGHRMPIC
jgi:hypothetical protein